MLLNKKNKKRITSTVVPRTSVLYGARNGPDYQGIITTEGELLSVCNIQHIIIQC
jgi:hypothetical protein